MSLVRSPEKGGRRLDVEGVTLLHMRDGRCVKRWSRNDEVTMMQQVGLMPPA